MIRFICDSAGGAYSPAARWAQGGADVLVAHYYHDHPVFDDAFRSGGSDRTVTRPPAAQAGEAFSNPED
jgi:hypothetical protein